METVETLVSVYIKGSNKLSKVRYSFAPLNTHNYTELLRLIVLVFPSPKIDLSIGLQAAFDFVFSGVQSEGKHE